MTDSYHFDGRNLTAYGGLLPVTTMLEKFGFQHLLEQTRRVQREIMSWPDFVVACWRSTFGKQAVLVGTNRALW